MVYRTLRGVVAPVLVIILALALALVPAAPAAAAGHGPGAHSTDRNADEPHPAVGAFTSWLDAFLARWADETLAVWAALGSGMDPNGEPTAESTDGPIGDPELGGGIDPDG